MAFIRLVTPCQCKETPKWPTWFVLSKKNSPHSLNRNRFENICFICRRHLEATVEIAKRALGSLTVKYVKVEIITTYSPIPIKLDSYVSVQWDHKSNGGSEWRQKFILNTFVKENVDRLLKTLSIKCLLFLPIVLVHILQTSKKWSALNWLVHKLTTEYISHQAKYLDYFHVFVSLKDFSSFKG